MKFRKLVDLRLSIQRKKDRILGRWRNKDKNTAITIFINNFNEDNIIEHINKTLLIEYLCSCVFRGNRIKKNCDNTIKDRSKYQITCYPNFIAKFILALLKFNTDYVYECIRIDEIAFHFYFPKDLPDGSGNIFPEVYFIL